MGVRGAVCGQDVVEAEAAAFVWNVSPAEPGQEYRLGIATGQARKEVQMMGLTIRIVCGFACTVVGPYGGLQPGPRAQTTGVACAMDGHQVVS